MNRMIRNGIMKRYRLHVMIASACLLTGCSHWPFSHKDDYSAAKPGTQLQIPPDLTHPSVSDRYDVPQAGENAAPSQESAPAVHQEKVAVLPQFTSVKIEDAVGGKRLVVYEAPEIVWPMVKAFWLSLGYKIKSEDPKIGVMQTDWQEYHPDVDSNGMHSFLHKHLGINYSSGVRNQFTARLERAGTSTRVYISQKGMQQVTKKDDFSDESTSVWEPVKSDPELQAEMLQRLMVSIGSTEKAAKKIETASANAAPAAEAESTPSEPTHAKLSEQDNDITLDLPVDRAWRRVGLALDKVGFTVDDQNRAKGTYFVSYADPDAKKADEGFLSNLEFWKDKKPLEPQKFQIQVGTSGNGSIVSVLDRDGFHVHTETSAKILRLIFEQLK